LFRFREKPESSRRGHESYRRKDPRSGQFQYIKAKNPPHKNEVETKQKRKLQRQMRGDTKLSDENAPKFFNNLIKQASEAGGNPTEIMDNIRAGLIQELQKTNPNMSVEQAEQIIGDLPRRAYNVMQTSDSDSAKKNRIGEMILSTFRGGFGG